MFGTSDSTRDLSSIWSNIKAAFVKSNNNDSWFDIDYEHTGTILFAIVFILALLVAIKWLNSTGLIKNAIGTGSPVRDKIGAAEADSLNKQWVIAIVILLFTLGLVLFSVYTVGTSILQMAILTVGVCLGGWMAYSKSVVVQGWWSAIYNTIYNADGRLIRALVIGTCCFIPSIALARLGYDLNGRSGAILLFGIGFIITTFAVWGPLKARYPNETSFVATPVVTYCPPVGTINK